MTPTHPVPHLRVAKMGSNSTLNPPAPTMHRAVHPTVCPTFAMLRWAPPTFSSLVIALLTLFTLPLHPQQSPPTLADRLIELLKRDAGGHSPSPEDLQAASNLQPPPSGPELEQALPILRLALTSSDTPVRTCALSTLLALQSTTAAPESGSPSAPPAPTPTQAPATYSPAIARLLAPVIPQIAARLTDDSQPNRLLTAAILAGFTPDPPSAVYSPLLAFLRRDDAAGATGLAVVSALLQLGPPSAETSSALARYLRRGDQSPSNRATLAESIAASRNQSQTLNQVLLAWLDSDDPGLRARVILSLPQLDLAPGVFADTRLRIAQLAENPSESLPVVTAAKSITPCWTAPHQPTPCPAYQ